MAIGLAGPVSATLCGAEEAMKLRTISYLVALPKQEQLDLLRRQRRQVISVKEHLFDGDLRAAAKAIDTGEMRYPILLGDYAEDALDFTHEWLGRLEVKLEAEIAAESDRR
jgi:hypothetical protein